MKLARKLIVSAIAASALMAGTPAAFAATTSAHTAVMPAVYKWLDYGSYPTNKACNSEGDYIVLHINGNYTYKCVEYSEGSYFIWKLFVGVPS